MKILLLSPPFVKEYMRNARCDFVSLSATQWYPILLGACGAYLESKGHEVKLVDAPAHYLDHDATRAVVRAFRPELVVLYNGKKSERNDLDFMDPLMEELGCDVVIAGPFASIAPEETLSGSKNINKLVTGEFEKPVAEVAARLPLKDIKNLVWRDGDLIVRNPERAYLTGAELDDIPFVSRFFRDQVDVRRYKTPSELFPYMDIMTGRGCRWGLCTYCLWANTYVSGSLYNTRSAPNVIGEFEFMTKEMPYIKSVMIQDDTFTEDRARAFSEAKIEAGLRLPWSCYARADMSLDVLRLMKRAGCRNLHVGFESADPEALKRIKKGLSVERMTQFNSDAKRAGLRIHGDFAIGFPGETPESAMKTVRWALDMNPDTAQFQLMIPFPGTPYYDEMKANGWINEEGRPDMPGFSDEQMRAVAKKAYRAFYVSPSYLWKCVKSPREHFFNRFKSIVRAIPAMFWKKWDV